MGGGGGGGCALNWANTVSYTGELGYDGPLYDGFLHMTDNMLGPSSMHIKYLSYVYDGFCISRTNFPGPIESVISKFTCSNGTEQEKISAIESPNEIRVMMALTWKEFM